MALESWRGLVLDAGSSKPREMMGSMWKLFSPRILGRGVEGISSTSSSGCSNRGTERRSTELQTCLFHSLWLPHAEEVFTTLVKSAKWAGLVGLTSAPLHVHRLPIGAPLVMDLLLHPPSLHPG